MNGVIMKQRTIKIRKAFTLIELLMVITIIAMLGAMSITVSRSSLESARRSKTEITIRKLDTVITAMYEKYQYRKVDVKPYQTMIKNYATNYYKNQNNPWGFPTGYLYPSGANHQAKMPYPNVMSLQAWVRLMILRDTIRMDMPCCLAEVYGPVWPNDNNSGMVPDNNRTRTPLSSVYFRAMVAGGYLDNNGNPVKVPDERGVLNAELLYLIVSNGDPNARSMFSEKEIADTNGNGLMEFIDGWGRPIYWERWAPALPDTDRQTSLYENYETLYPDSLNPLGEIVECRPEPVSETLADGSIIDHYLSNWMLVPLIYSTGPDGQHGVDPGAYSEYNMTNNNDRFNVLKSTLYPFIQVKDGNGNWVMNNLAGSVVNAAQATDNVHNHTLVR